MTWKTIRLNRVSSGILGCILLQVSMMTVPDLGIEDGVVRLSSQVHLRRGSPAPMDAPHRHDDLEVNIVLAGSMSYLFGGESFDVAAGNVVLFWGATPHQLIGPIGQRGEVCWVHIPLPMAMAWSLPPVDLAALLHARPIVVPRDEATVRLLSALHERWIADLRVPDSAAIALLEAEALVRRTLLEHRRRMGLLTDDGGSPPDGMRWVSVMAQFAVTRFREAITPGDVAAAANLNTTYAMSLFRRAVGMTIGEYLARCRVAEAKRLLVTTDIPIGDVAHLSGFGSTSSFYEQFHRVSAETPRVYRSRRR
jgi:AraC-like DNA-binding protein